MNLVGAVAAAPGVAEARRVGVDGMTPLFEQLLAAMMPGAELVDAEAVLRDARRVKSSDDIGAIRAAVTVAEDAMGAATEAFTPGVRERELKGVFEQRMAEQGVTTPAFEGTFCVADAGRTPRTLTTDRQLVDGDLVHLRAGVLRDGWEAWLARTWPCGDAPRVTPDTLARTTLAGVIRECRAGVGVGALQAAAPGVAVDGIGMGHEELADHDVLEAGMVLGIEVLADGMLVGDMLLVTSVEPETLTTFPDGPG
jgi:Xaa-Pro dipeptidase